MAYLNLFKMIRGLYWNTFIIKIYIELVTFATLFKDTLFKSHYLENEYLLKKIIVFLNICSIILCFFTCFSCYLGNFYINIFWIIFCGQVFIFCLI